MDEGSPEPKNGNVLIDTHAHLDDPAFADDLEAVLAASLDAGVRAWVNVGYAPERWETTIALAETVPGMAHMLGMHPQNAAGWNEENAARLEALLVETNARAIGEIGLDYAPHAGAHGPQRTAFADQLRLAERLRLPVVIHMRDAEADLMDQLRTLDPAHPVLLHCFDGSHALLKFALHRGYLLGVGGLATRTKSERLRSLLRDAPLGALVLETDSPYLVPAKLKERRNQPANVALIARFVSELRGQPVGEIARVTTANAERFFGAVVTATERAT
jgi:TatD DNase family protein